MIWRDMPPLAMLRAFHAFSRAETLAEAGAELNVSHAAISQQIRALEARLGQALVDRRGRSLALTPQGQRLAEALSLGFGAIFAAVQELSEDSADRPLHVSLTPSFASSWLMPRLPDFQMRHPEVELTLDPSVAVVTLEPGGVDLALRFGVGPWPGLASEQLFSVRLTVVAAPGLVPDRPDGAPLDLTGLPLLEELGTSETTRRLRELGFDTAHRGRRLQLPGNLLADAARDGQGIAVVVREFVEADIQAGRLVVLVEDESAAGYHIVTRPGPRRPALRDFVRWLRGQAG